MSDTLTPPSEALRAAEPEFRRRRRLSPIWAVPIVAALVAGWLGYTAFTEKGPAISISFKTAAGLEAGKTRVKHHDIDLGMVERVEPSADLSHVIVIARMSKMAAPHLNENSRFWVVRPRFSLTGLSGLETIVSGAYIEMDPGEGKASRSFAGLETPPVVRSDVPGTEFVLTTQKLGSIGPGSPIYFRGISVGEVMSDTFTGIEAGIVIRIFVRKPFDALVYDGTRFWNASGITLTTGASGFKVEVDSLQAVLAGGIAFETPEIVRKGEPSKEGTTFPLYDDHAQALDASYTKATRVILEFAGSVRGLDIGAPVDFRGMKIGKVIDIQLDFNPATKELRIPVTVEIEMQRIHLTSGDYDQYGGGVLMREFVARGLRAQLRTASLITGQLMVAFDFFPDAPPASVVLTDTYPELPTVPNELANITRSVTQTLDKIADLPLDAVVHDLRQILQSVEEITGSPELKESVKSLSKAIIAFEHLARDADTQMGPLLTSLRQASDAADSALKRVSATLASASAGYGSDSRIHTDLSDLLRQLQETARSVRVLANYLEQHPEALIRGKAGPAQ